jgi:hypothetical protein
VTITVDDPQPDVDRLIRQARETLLHSAHRAFDGYTKGAIDTAARRHYAGDKFGECLAKARVRVYEQAAELVREMPVDDAAVEMMRRALRAQVRTPRWVGYDADAVSYITARAWQFCAWKINPSLPEVQPRWA